MFSAIENSSTRPRRWRSSGIWPTPSSKCCRTDSSVMSRPDERDAAAVDPPQPASRLDQLRLAVAVDAGDPTISPARTSNETSAHLLDARDRRGRGASTRSSGSPGRRCRPSLLRSSTSRPTIRRASSSSVAPSADSVSIDLAATKHGDPVGDVEHLVELVADEDDRQSLTRRACARMPKSSPASWGVSTAVGSSRMRTSARRYRALRISTRCCWPTVMSWTRASGRSRSRMSPRGSRRALGGPCVVEQDVPVVGSIASTMFSATVMTGMSMKCWCTMPIPRSIASSRRLTCCTASPLTTISPSSGW